MLSFDTNILVYATDNSAGLRHRAAHRLISSAVGKDVGLTEQSLIEFLHVATRKARLSLSDAAKAVRGYLTYFPLLVPHGGIVADVLALLDRYRMETWDARLVAVCAARGCTHLLSEDLQDGAHYGSITVVNPFNPANAALIGRLLS
ncbi:MAG TPA: PIN domain-containing protein [Rhizomicrobium sp.]|nr:PIN domain-containing protein [Rhizomicrobium sp.]